MNEKKAVLLNSTAQADSLVLFDRISLTLYFVLLFLSMTVTTGRMSVILTAAALVLTVLYVLVVSKHSLSVLRQNLSIPVIGFMGFALMNGLAAIYSDFGGYAVGELNKFLSSFAISALLLFCFQKRYTNAVLWGLSSISASIGLLGIDAACHGPLFGTFQKLMLALGTDYSYVNEAAFAGRLNGIYNDSNVTAAVLALGCMLSMYLIIKESKVWKRFLASLLLGCSAVSFFVSVSRGAIVCFALALLVWFIVSAEKYRIHLFLLTVFSAISTVVFSSVITSCLGGELLIATLLPVACGLLIFVLDWLMGIRLSVFLQKHMKAAAILIVFFIISGIAFCIAAVTLSGPLTLPTDHTIVRSAKLPAGEYSISGDWDGNPTLRIYARSKQDTLQEKYPSIYDGPLSNASFTIENDITNILFYLSSDQDIELREIAFSNGAHLHLDYPLLPDSISSRLQDGLLSGRNFLQRLQYDKDAITLWKQSPLLGHGLGSTEALYTSVQPYFYESLYVHNHIFQVLCDMGLVGAIFFLTMMLGVAWLLIRHLIKERDLLTGMLLACWVMINTHSLMEINFSVRGYQCFVYPLLMFMAALYAPPIKEKAAKAAGIIGAAAIWLLMAVFGGLMASHNAVAREAASLSTSDANIFMSKMNNFIRRDVFDNEQYKLNYVVNALALNHPGFNDNMVKYAEDLRESGTYTACSGLAKYYYLPQGDFENLFACSREGIAQEASTKEAWNLQLTFYRTEVIQAVTPENYEQFISGVLETKAYLEEYSKDHWEEIALEEENQTFLNMVQSLRDNNIDAEAGIFLLSSVK